MADRFMNREPQIGRMQNERFLASDSRFGFVHRHRFFRGDPRFFEQRIGLDVFVAGAHRRGQRVARIELAGGAIDRRDRKPRYDRISDCSM